LNQPKSYAKEFLLEDLPILERIKLLQDMGGLLDDESELHELKSKVGCRYRIDEIEIKKDRILVHRTETEDPYKKRKK